MSWLLVAAVLGAGTLGAFTDWLFMGVLFHEAYNRYPEVWRPGIREGAERTALIWSTILGFVMSAAVIGLCELAGVHDVLHGLMVAGIAWLAGPFVVVVINGFFIKIDPRITVSHCLGWLVRMAIAGVAA